MKSKVSNNTRVTVSVVIPEDFYRELKVKAAIEEMSLSRFLEQLLRLGLQEYEKQASKGIPASTIKELIGVVSYKGDAVKDTEEIYE